MKKYPFSGVLRWSFTPTRLDQCARCGKPWAEHTNSKCLFEATEFEKEILSEFLVALLRNGGELTIKTEGFTFSQKLKGLLVDDLGREVRSEAQLAGQARVEKHDA